MNNEYALDVENMTDTEIRIISRRIIKHAIDNRYTVEQMCEHISKADLFKESFTKEEILKSIKVVGLTKISSWYTTACAKIGLPLGGNILTDLPSPL